MSTPYDPQADDSLEDEEELEHWSSPNGCAEGCPACEATLAPNERDRIIADRERDERMKYAAPQLLVALQSVLDSEESTLGDGGSILGDETREMIKFAISLTEPPKTP